MSAKLRGRLAEAGYVRLPGPERHYRAPDGKEVSYRAAFLAARGESLEAAVKMRGKFRDEHRVAEQVRAAAKAGDLSKRGLASRDEERLLARSTVRQLIKGHAKRGQFLPGKKGAEGQRRGAKRPPPERASVYSRRVLAVLHGKDNSARGKKARLLVAMGRRAEGAEYAVGDTP
jgi:hypothetical protein